MARRSSSRPIVGVGGIGNRLTEGGRSRSHQVRVVSENRLLQLSEGGCGLEAELLVQQLPRGAIGLECLGLAAAAIQRQHELTT